MPGVGQWYEIIGKGRFGPDKEGGSALNARTRRLDFVCIVDDNNWVCLYTHVCFDWRNDMVEQYMRAVNPVGADSLV